MKTDANMLGQIVIALGSIASLFVTAQKLIKDIKAEREQENEKILKKALEEIENAKEMTEIKIDICFDEIDSLRASTEKDIENLKKSYEKELENIKEKVDDIKEEVRNQNNQILSLLSKLISE